MRVVDLTVPLGPSTPVYPGDPEPRARVVSTHSQGYYLREVCFSEHAGTHVDAPAHFLPGGQTIDRVPAEHLVGPAVIVDARQAPRRGTVAWSLIRDALTTRPPSEWRRLFVLVATATLERFGDPWDYPVISEDAARRLAEIRVRGLGVDAPSPDREP